MQEITELEKQQQHYENETRRLTIELLRETDISKRKELSKEKQVNVKMMVAYYLKRIRQQALMEL